jgi:hypothetical protein
VTAGAVSVLRRERARLLLDHLRSIGLDRVERLVLTRNRAVIVSVRGSELRVHEAFVDADEEFREAVVSFVMARRRVDRAVARERLIALPLPVSTIARRTPLATDPEDAHHIPRLEGWHAGLNADHFGGALGRVTFRVSRRMRRRLGHYAPGREGAPSEIAISERHLRRDGLDAARATLLHEMVHQWQHEQGLPVDHGPEFRRMCREVGAPARAPRASSRARARALP